VGRGTVGAHVDRRKSPDKIGRAIGDRGKLGNYSGLHAVLAYRWAIGERFGRTRQQAGGGAVERHCHALAKGRGDGASMLQLNGLHTLLGERIAERSPVAF
jgi:hypothetical protein